MSTYIENKGVFALLTILNNTKKINPLIRFNDKTPLWDGELYVYSKEGNWPKEDLFGRLMVQVKTISVEHYNNYINIPIGDIKKYDTENGLIYFYIQLNREKYKIYYYILTSYEIKKALKENKKNVRFKFRELPVTNLNELYIICKDAIRKIDANKTILNGVLSIDDAIKLYPNSELSFDINIKKEANIFDLIKEVNDQNPYLYLKPRGLENRFCIDKIGDELKFQIIERKKSSILVDDELIYDQVKVLVSIDSTEFSYEDNLKFIFYKDNYKDPEILFGLEGNLNSRIKVLKVMRKMIKDKELKLNDKIFSFEDFYLEDLDLNQVTFTLELYLMIDAIFKELGIDKEIDLTSLTNENIQTFISLYKALFDNISLKLDNQQDEWFFLRFLDINIILSLEKLENDNYKIYNFFDSNNNNSLLLDNTKISRYAIIGNQFPKENLLKFCDNINYEKMTEEICDYKIKNKKYVSICNMLILALIDYYDYSKKEIALNTSKKIMGYLKQNFSNYIDINLILNNYQIIKRENKLTDDDISILLEIKNKNSDNLVKFAASVLLDNQMEAKYFLDLCDERKEIIKKYPIYNLFNES